MTVNTSFTEAETEAQRGYITCSSSTYTATQGRAEIRIQALFGLDEVRGTRFLFHLKQLEDWTKYTKQLISDIEQESVQD